MSEPIDFEAEGLLDGLVGDERASRVALLQRLVDDGAGAEELRSAVTDGRLALLPLERMLFGRPRYTSVEVAERSGIPIDELERQWRSIGIAVPDREEAVMNREDLDSADRMRAILDVGVAPDQLAELGRTIAVSMSQFAAASRQVMGQMFVGPGGSEDEVSDRLFEGAGGLIPIVGPTLDYIYRLHLRDQLRHAAFNDEETVGQAAGAPTGSERIAVGFADLVGFTKLGEELAPEALGKVTGRLEEVAREVAHGPVRLVKLIGDAAMFASADTPALLATTHELVEVMAAEGDGFPLIRAGVAYGPVLSRGGDYYGRPVNLANRITTVARPGSILVTTEVCEHVADGSFEFSRAGRKHLKGISGSIELHRSRRPGSDAEASPAAI